MKHPLCARLDSAEGHKKQHRFTGLTLRTPQELLEVHITNAGDSYACTEPHNLTLTYVQTHDHMGISDTQTRQKKELFPECGLSMMYSELTRRPLF